MARIFTKKKLKEKITEDMKLLGTYKFQYDMLIDIYAQLIHEYLILTKKFNEDGFKYEVKTDQGGNKKSPIVAALESLRKDILQYSDRLCLSPKAIESITPEINNRSKLLDVLSKVDID